MRTAICTLALVSLALPIQGKALTPETPHATALFSHLPLLFVENRGQLDEAVRFSVPGAGRTLYFTRDGVTVALEGDGRRWALKLDFVDANPNQVAVFSYFQGNDPEKWQAGCPTYARIVYENLWPGIDLVYRGEVGRLKHEFVVAPGADPRRIRFEVRGATGVQVDAQGDLVLETPLGSFRDTRPIAYQMRDGARVDVEAAFTLEGTQVGFALGTFDPSLPLVLDPETIVYGSFLGGSSLDEGFGVAVDASGAVYVAGLTYSPYFPTAGGPDPCHNGLSDAFIVKIDPTGSALVYGGFLGGFKEDVARAVAVDETGAAYLTGYAGSANFPTVGTLGPSRYGLCDAFVTKIDPTGSTIVYSGFLGGSYFDEGTDIAIDPTGAAYVTGRTISPDLPILGELGPTNHGGPSDAFVAKVDAAGSALVYCGYVGGSGEESGSGIAVDSSGAAYLTGYTNSLDFPSVGSLGPSHDDGAFDAFLLKVDASGSTIAYSGCLGGSSDDSGSKVAVNVSGEAFVTGTTASVDFPIAGSLDPSFNGGTLDAFVAKVDAQGNALVYSGFLGGSSDDEGRGIAVDDSDAVYLTGLTASADFPVLGGLDASYNEGTSDAFVAGVNPPGTALVLSGFLGGSSSETGHAIALDASGAMLVAGATSSDNFPTPGGLDPTFNGGTLDAFVAKILVPDSLTCRSGTLGVATGPLPPVVLRINGSEGDENRAVVVTVGSAVAITMDTPPLGPSPAPFAMYGWVGEPNASTVTPHPKGVGAMCFPTPVTGGLPQPNRIWNNIGHPTILGYPHFPSEPAPSTPFSKVWGIPFAITATFQGFIFDEGSSADHPVSLTNAVILKLVP